MTVIRVSEVADAALKAGKAGTGLLACRFGHCEARTMGFPSHSTREEMNASLQLQLGRDDYTDEQCRYISEQIRKSYKYSDIVGLGHSNGAWIEESQYLDILLRRVAEIVQDEQLIQPYHRYTTANIHLEMLTTGELDRVIAGFDDILLISCRNVSQRFEAKYGFRPKQLFVPQEARTSGLDDDIVNAWHYPDAFSAIMKAIPSLVRPGTLVLLGAGFLGKIYGLAAKNAGGVVLDIGSIFDIWAGVRSRSGMAGALYPNYALPFVGEKDPNFSSTLPEKKDATVDLGGREPAWSLRDASTTEYTVSSNKKATQIDTHELFIHSSVKGDNWVEFVEVANLHAGAMVATLAVTNPQAANTQFIIEGEIEGRSFKFSKTCRPDDTLTWLQFLPVTGRLTRLRVSTRPVDGAGSTYGWAFVRRLRFY